MADVKNEIIECQSPVGKFNYVYLNEPQPDEHDVKWYKLTIAWPKSFYNTELLDLRRKATEAAKQKWGASIPKLQPFLRDGDNPEHNSSDSEDLFGCYYITAKCKAEKGRPEIVDRLKNPLTPLDVYSGCTGRVSLILGGYDTKGKKGVWIRLQNVQKAGDGERIGGRPSAKKQFDELPAGADDDLLGTSDKTDDIAF